MQQYVKQVWIAVGVAAVVLLSAWLFSEIFFGLLVIFAGIMLGVVLAKLSNLLSRVTGIPYRAAYSVVLFLLVALIFVVFALMGAQISQQAGEFIKQLRQSSQQLQNQLTGQAWWSEIQSLREDVMGMLASQQAVSTATSAVSTVISTFAGGVLVAFLGIYFAIWPERYRNGLLSLVPPNSRERVGNVVDMTAEAVWYWVLGRMVGMVVIGVGSGLGLWALGVPLPIALGVLAGVLTFVPNVGPLIALVPAVLFSLQVGTDTALYVIMFYLALQTVESYLLTPMIDQYQVSVPPGLTLSAQLLFGLVGGMLGLLLATPLVVVISILLRELYVRDILGSEPVKTE